MAMTRDSHIEMPPEEAPPPHIIANQAERARAVILSVPHAGRYYPPALLERARASAHSLQRLEDRYADRLVQSAIQLGYKVQIATHARGWIDLNRTPQDIDVAMVRDADKTRAATRIAGPSEKVRAGLGLFPRRLADVGELWHGGFDWADYQARIAAIHQPYHDALTGLMDEAMRAHGHALLIDVHSMPSISGIDPPEIVIGDRFGAAAPAWLVGWVEEEVARAGFRVASNRPYAGGYIIERHSRPAMRRYALQIEVDRALYLDAHGEPDAAGCARISSLIARLTVGAEIAMADRFGSGLWQQAAE